jgi:hypothetical protein
MALKYIMHRLLEEDEAIEGCPVWKPDWGNGSAAAFSSAFNGTIYIQDAIDALGDNLSACGNCFPDPDKIAQNVILEQVKED